MMSSALPPLASDAAITPAKAAPALRGSSLSATLPLYSGFFRSANVFGAFGTIVVFVVIAMIAVVGRQPSCWPASFRPSGIWSHVDGLYGSKYPAVIAILRLRRADVDAVGHVVLAGEVLDRVELFLRRELRAGHRVLDAGVLVAERLQDALVVRPVVGQGDQVDLTFRLAGVVQRRQVGSTAARGGCRRGGRTARGGGLGAARRGRRGRAAAARRGGVRAAVAAAPASRRHQGRGHRERHERPRAPS